MTTEQKVAEIKQGTPFLYPSPLDQGKVWKIEAFRDGFIISHNRSKRKKALGQRAVFQIVHNCLNEAY